MIGYFSYLILTRRGRQVVGGLQNNNRVTQQTIGKSVFYVKTLLNTSINSDMDTMVTFFNIKNIQNINSLSMSKCLDT